MGLTLEKIKAEKPDEKKRKYLSDGRGLLLEVNPNGSKYWLVRFYINQKEKRKYFGAFPEIDIKQARDMAMQIKEQAKLDELKKFDPVQPEKRIFREVAEEWNEVLRQSTSEENYRKTKCRLAHLYKAIGDLELSAIRPAHILAVCRELEKDGKTDTAHRVKSVASQVFNFADAPDPTTSLRGKLVKHKKKHYSAIIDEPEIAGLMRKIDSYKGKNTRLALFFSVLTFARPGEVRKAEWSEIDWEKQEWRISAEKMKMDRPHIVPLSSQTLEILKELKELTGTERWLFPNERKSDKPMSENTILYALRGLGYQKDEMTAHGFRSMASTVLNENEYNPDFIEKQLSHEDTDKVRGSYNRAKWLKQRTEMMQWWGNYLDRLTMFDSSKEADEMADILGDSLESHYGPLSDDEDG